MESFDASLDLVRRLEQLVGQDYQVYIFQGLPCYITKPPFRYLMHVDGTITPLFKTPDWESIEIDEQGILSDNWDEADIHNINQELDSAGDEFDQWEDPGSSVELVGQDYVPFDDPDNTPPWDDNLIPAFGSHPSDGGHDWGEELEPPKEVPGPGMPDESQAE